MASWLVKVGFFCVMVRFFFPRVFVDAGHSHRRRALRRRVRLLKMRTGFEGMELAITQAAAAARAADPGRAAAAKAAAENARSRRTIPGACVALGGGVLLLAVAVAVQPQAGGWFVYSVAVLLRIFYGAGGVAALLIGAGILHSALRDRRAVRRPGQEQQG